MKKIVILLLALPVLLKGQATSLEVPWIDPYLVDRIEAMDYKYKGEDWVYDFQPGIQLDQVSFFGATLGDPIRMIRYKDKIFLLLQATRCQVVVQIGVTKREYFSWLKREGLPLAGQVEGPCPSPTRASFDEPHFQIIFSPPYGHEEEFEAVNVELFKLES